MSDSLPPLKKFTSDVLPSNVTIKDALHIASTKRPSTWSMYNRTIKGAPYTFDVSGLFSKLRPDASKRERLQLLLRHRPFLVQPLNDEHPHKVYKKARQVGVSELSLTEVLWFLEAHPNTKWVYCLPDDAEILTRRGWKKWFEVSPKDEALSLDAETFTSSWEPVKRVSTFDWDGELPAIGPFHCTPNHRWPVQVRRTRVNTRRRGPPKFKLYGGERKVVEAKDVKKHLHLIPRLAPHRHDGSKSLLSPRLAAILGWLVTDGYHASAHSASVSQSSHKHLRILEKLLKSKARPANRWTNAETQKIGPRGGRIVGKDRKGRNLYGDGYLIRIRKADLQALYAAGYSSKQDLPSIVTRLSPVAMHAMWEAMMLADGTRHTKSGRGRKSKSWFFAKDEKQPWVRDAFQILCSLLGYYANLNKRGAYVVTPDSREAWLSPAGHKTPSRNYKGKVWCPQVPSKGTVLMRYRGKVVFTGQTFPREKQLTDFSTTRINEVMEESPRMKHLFGVPNQTFLKKIGFSSFLLLRSAWESNLGEGIDADGVTFDEKDRMKEGIEVAFRESLSSSKYNLLREVSTPTLPGRGVDASFLHSDQMEWHIRCTKCGMWQTIEYPENVIQMMDIPPGAKELPEGAFEYRCRKDKCRGDLDRVHGQWIAKYPSRANIRGYLIPQTICPWINATQLMQKKIDYKFQQLWENYSSLPGFPVLTNNGPKLIEQVTTADSVFTHKARWRRVTALHPHLYNGTIVDVYVGGDYRKPTLSVTRDHPVLLEGGGWLNAEHLVAEQRSTGYKGHWLCYPKPKLPEEPQHLSLSGLVTNEWARFYGLFLAEGCATAITTVHHKKEKGLIAFSKRMLGRLGNVYTQDPAKYEGQSQQAVVVGGSLTNDSKAFFLDLYGGTLANKRIPAFVFGLPRVQKLAFLRGYVEGDGYISEGTLELQTCSPHIGHGLQLLIADLGYYAKLRGHRNKLNGETFMQHRLTYSGAPGRKLLRELGYPARDPERSYTFYREDSDFFLLPVRKVVKREVANERVYNFAVKDDESYLLNGVVSHNCLGRTSIGENILLSEQDFENATAGHEMVGARTPDWDMVSIGIDWGHLNWVVVIGRNATNGKKYLLNIGVFEDDLRNELDSVKRAEEFIAPYEPDLIIADAGYGKDRNAYLLRKYPNKLFSCYYNPSEKGSRTFIPSWSDAFSKVLVDRTMTLKNTCRIIKERELGLPRYDRAMQTWQKHFMHLAPLREEEDGEIFEVISSTGDDHLAHATGYALLGFDKMESSLSSFSFDFLRL